jgi:hypothetical protein
VLDLCLEIPPPSQSLICNGQWNNFLWYSQFVGQEAAVVYVWWRFSIK